MCNPTLHHRNKSRLTPVHALRPATGRRGREPHNFTCRACLPGTRGASAKGITHLTLFLSPAEQRSLEKADMAPMAIGQAEMRYAKLVANSSFGCNLTHEFNCYTCPCCGFQSFEEPPGSHQICSHGVCDDGSENSGIALRRCERHQPAADGIDRVTVDALVSAEVCKPSRDRVHLSNTLLNTALPRFRSHPIERTSA
jgi:hypothetical protein